jgi:hypothetical protein
VLKVEEQPPSGTKTKNKRLNGRKAVSSLPRSTWHQHFNVQGGETARFVALTDKPPMINRFRNLDFIFGNDFRLWTDSTAKMDITTAREERLRRTELGNPISFPTSETFS